MENLRKMISHVPIGSCPRCNRKQFVVWNSTEDIYLTNFDGEIIDHKEIGSHSVGKCLNCGSIFDMMERPTGFIPLTTLRKILFNCSSDIGLIENDTVDIPNPMEKK